MGLFRMSEVPHTHTQTHTHTQPHTHTNTHILVRKLLDFHAAFEEGGKNCRGWKDIEMEVQNKI